MDPFASSAHHPLRAPDHARGSDVARARAERAAGRLAENIVHFARALRAAGIPVGPGAVMDALAAVEAAGVGMREDFYWTLHAVLVKRHEHSLIFDQAFRIFFRRRGMLDKLLAMMLPQSPAREEEKAPPGAQRIQEALLSSLAEAEKKPPQLEADARLTVSDREVLQKKDFAQMTAAEIAAAKDAIKRLVLSLDEVKTRRLAPHRHGHLVDIRRTLRASLKAGGAVIDLKYLGPRSKSPPIVALLDISGSMSQYTRLFLHFLHAVTDARKRVHTFLFGTRLTNVTRALKARDPDEALAAVGANVADWSGGTRIATSLRAFNKLWARRVLTEGAIVLLITDGLERDPDDRLAFEIDRLHRSCRRLIWLNPLLRFSGFEAKAKGIRAMVPHVDELRPIHNLDSMAELVRALSPTGGRSGDPKAWLDKVA
ncbi:MAG TPA: VWA domain-containing protein [Xanthobacteraceae bacterium]|nr:VWA domain-containing protein [Xanthobacteraceae bacterium]